jgi:hypothetical protein
MFVPFLLFQGVLATFFENISNVKLILYPYSELFTQILLKYPDSPLFMRFAGCERFILLPFNATIFLQRPHHSI